MEERAHRIIEKLHRELGPIVCSALEDKRVIEIMLNADGTLWIERLGEPMAPAGTISPAQAESAMATVAASLRTTITRENPILECELPLDGSRFEALIPPVVASPTFTIRKKASQVFRLNDYILQGIMSQAQAIAIGKGVEERKNILIVGGTGSGKTTLANAIIQHIVEVTPEHRLVIIEDTPEIQCNAKNAVILRATDEVDMLRLLKATMRLRPDRIIVGEVRGGEALALLKALNTGHNGGGCTVHANSARAGLTRLEQLISEESKTPMPQLIAEAIDLIVFIAKTSTGRKVQEVVSVDGFDGNNYLINQL